MYASTTLQVTLTTLHGSKGREWERVYIVGCGEKEIPLLRKDSAKPTDDAPQAAEDPELSPAKIEPSPIQPTEPSPAQLAAPEPVALVRAPLRQAADTLGIGMASKPRPVRLTRFPPEAWSGSAAERPAVAGLVDESAFPWPMEGVAFEHGSPGRLAGVSALDVDDYESPLCGQRSPIDPCVVANPDDGVIPDSQPSSSPFGAQFHFGQEPSELPQAMTMESAAPGGALSTALCCVGGPRQPSGAAAPPLAGGAPEGGVQGVSRGVSSPKGSAAFGSFQDFVCGAPSWTLLGARTAATGGAGDPTGPACPSSPAPALGVGNIAWGAEADPLCEDDDSSDSEPDEPEPEGEDGEPSAIAELSGAAASDGGGNVEEERRLLYVGVTRARKFLTLVGPPGLEGKKGKASGPSPFLAEIPSALCSEGEALVLRGGAAGLKKAAKKGSGKLG